MKLGVVCLKAFPKEVMGRQPSFRAGTLYSLLHVCGVVCALPPPHPRHLPVLRC